MNDRACLIIINIYILYSKSARSCDRVTRCIHISHAYADLTFLIAHEFGFTRSTIFAYAVPCLRQLTDCYALYVYRANIRRRKPVSTHAVAGKIKTNRFLFNVHTWNERLPWGFRAIRRLRGERVFSPTVLYDCRSIACADDRNNRECYMRKRCKLRANICYFGEHVFGYITSVCDTVPWKYSAREAVSV